MSRKYNTNWLFLDDVRSPHPKYGFDIVRTYDEFVEYITKNGIPKLISFDHDLCEKHYIIVCEEDANDTSFELEKPGELEKTGLECLRWLIKYCEDNDLILADTDISIHSMNPVGRIRILDEVNDYFNKKAYKKTVYFHNWDYI